MQNDPHLLILKQRLILATRNGEGARRAFERVEREIASLEKAGGRLAEECQPGQTHHAAIAETLKNWIEWIEAELSQAREAAKTLREA